MLLAAGRWNLYLHHEKWIQYLLEEGDAADGLLFGWEIATVQKWVLIYLGVSSLAFVLVWIVGALRTKG